MTRTALRFAAGAFVASLGAAEPVTLPEFAVNAERRLRPGETVGPTRWFDADALQAPLAVDRALRADPAFSLFRRSDSLAANPTAQGVSLRGLGPSGASRSLVLLDGVPLNDPFGGWVQWAQLPTFALAGAEVRPGGGSAAWGNAALGGVIALTSAPPGERTKLRATAGSFATRALEVATGTRAGHTALQADLRWFETDGFFPLRATDRGPVDQPLASTHRLVQLAASHRTRDVEARFTLRHFAEERNNGTLLQENATELTSATLALRGVAGEAAWQVQVYRQSQALRSFFTAVSPDRRSETPANDQFEVPADVSGLGATLGWDRGALAWTAGADLRAVRGETREDFLFTAGSFTRRRFAGGRQEFAGAFIGVSAQPAPAWTIDARVRGDRWVLRDGQRREADRATGVALRDERFPQRTGSPLSGQLELTWRARPGWTWHAAAATAFRVPTLNELHRPFRVGNTNTEANPALAPESMRSLETGLAWQGARGSVRLTAFLAEFDDAVGNVTLSSTPTAVSRQRLNLERSVSRGLEARAAWAPTQAWRAEWAALWTDATVRSAAVQPALVGRRLAQVPRTTMTGSLTWRPTPRWEARADARWSSRQFEDDENQLPLAAAGTIDLSLAFRFTTGVTLRVAAENLTDARVATARSFTAPTAYAAPRSLLARLAWDF